MVVARQLGDGAVNPAHVQLFREHEVGLGNGGDRFADFGGQIHHGQHIGGEGQACEHGHILLAEHVVAAEPGFAFGDAGVLFGLDTLRQLLHEFGGGSAVVADEAADVVEGAFAAQQLAGYMADKVGNVGAQAHLCFGRQAVVERLHGAETLFAVEQDVGHPVGAHHVGYGSLVFFAATLDEVHTHAIDDAVGQLVGDDFAPQVVLLHFAAVLLLERGGEIADKRGQEVGIVGEVAAQEVVLAVHFAVGQQYCNFRVAQAFPGFGAAFDFGFVRQEFHGAVEAGVFFQIADERGSGFQVACWVELGNGEGLGLQIVVLQHQLRHFVGHVPEQFVALFQR